MDPVKRASIIQKIIKILKELKRPEWFLADKIVTDVLDPELQEVKSNYERLFFTDPTDKH